MMEVFEVAATVLGVLVLLGIGAMFALLLGDFLLQDGFNKLKDESLVLDFASFAIFIILVTLGLAFIPSWLKFGFQRTKPLLAIVLTLSGLSLLFAYNPLYYLVELYKKHMSS